MKILTTTYFRTVPVIGFPEISPLCHSRADCNGCTISLCLHSSGVTCHLRGVFNEPRNLVFLCLRFASRSDSRIFGREFSESRIFVFWPIGFDQNHNKIVYLIKNVR